MTTVCRQLGADKVDAGEVVWPVQGVRAAHAATTQTDGCIISHRFSRATGHLMGAQLGGVSVSRQQSVLAGDTCIDRAN